MFWNKFPGQKYHTWFIQCGKSVINANIMHFQFLKRTFHRLLITGLTLHWKYHAPDESKLLYRGCSASFENRKFCIKLSKFFIKLSKKQSRKNIGIIGIFFPVSVFGFFSNTATAYCMLTWIIHQTQHSNSTKWSANIAKHIFHFQHWNEWMKWMERYYNYHGNNIRRPFWNVPCLTIL
jgi:hypothetical protein